MFKYYALYMNVNAIYMIGSAAGLFTPALPQTHE